MINLSNYKRMLKQANIGATRKNQSDLIMEATWDGDISSRIGYFYDWEHDTNRTVIRELSPERDSYKIPISIKYFEHTSQTFEKDTVTQHIQFKPSQDFSVVSYYEESFKQRYDARFPIGLYVDIQDERGVWNRWIVVAEADANGTQFPTFDILPCDKVINYIHKNVKYFVPAALRSQKSYNAGVWTDYRFTITEDIQKFIVPLNRETEKLYYNQRIIIDNNVLTEPRCWSISKINRISPNGVCNITLAQDMYNASTDYLDENGYWWADYYTSSGAEAVIQEPVNEDTVHVEITCAGSQEIKVGGSYKKLTANFVGGSLRGGNWTFFINGVIASDLLATSTENVAENQIKVKFIGSESYIGKTLTIRFISDLDEISEINIPIVSL